MCSTACAVQRAQHSSGTPLHHAHIEVLCQLFNKYQQSLGAAMQCSRQHAVYDHQHRSPLQHVQVPWFL